MYTMSKRTIFAFAAILVLSCSSTSKLGLHYRGGESKPPENLSGEECTKADFAKPCWLKAENTDCYIWNEEPRPLTSFTYSGECENNMANGFGVLSARTNIIKEESTIDVEELYIGKWKNGKKDGEEEVLYKVETGDVDDAFRSDLYWTYLSESSREGAKESVPPLEKIQSFKSMAYSYFSNNTHVEYSFTSALEVLCQPSEGKCHIKSKMRTYQNEITKANPHEEKFEKEGKERVKTAERPFAAPDRTKAAGSEDNDLYCATGTSYQIYFGERPLLSHNMMNKMAYGDALEELRGTRVKIQITETAPQGEEKIAGDKREDTIGHFSPASDEPINNPFIKNEELSPDGKSYFVQVCAPKKDNPLPTTVTNEEKPAEEIPAAP